MSIYLNLTGSMEQVLGMVGHWNPGLYHLFGGMGPRGVSHCVVARDGKIVHDPSMLGGGIVGPYAEGHFTVEFICPYLY